MVPIMASHCSHVDILVFIAAPARRLGVSVFSWGRLVLILGGWLSLKDCAISVKLGGHVDFSTHLSGGADTHSKIVCLTEVVGREVVATMVVEGVGRGLEHPRKGVVKKGPLEQALCIGFQLCTLVASWTPSSPSLELLQEVIFFQGEGGHLQGCLHW